MPGSSSHLWFHSHGSLVAAQMSITGYQPADLTQWPWHDSSLCVDENHSRGAFCSQLSDFNIAMPQMIAREITAYNLLPV